MPSWVKRLTSRFLKEHVSIDLGKAVCRLRHNLDPWVESTWVSTFQPDESYIPFQIYGFRFVNLAPLHLVGDSKQKIAQTIDLMVGAFRA